MKEMEELLAGWRKVKPATVALKELRTDDALQPRSMDCVNLAQESAERKRSEDHVAILASRLMSPGSSLEPILAVRTPDGLFVVDGHHRLMASRAAGRDEIQVRTLSLPWDEAVIASKFVNFGGEKMGVHTEQRRDAAWQWLASVTKRGTCPLPSGISQRAVAVRFSISVGNVNNMLGRLREGSIEAGAYKEDHRDPGTGWPRWRYVRNPAYGTEWTPPTEEERIETEGLKLALKIADAIERFGDGVVRSATRHLRERGGDPGDLEEALDYLASPDADEDY
jgi:hypothetical protein